MISDNIGVLCPKSCVDRVLLLYFHVLFKSVKLLRLSSSFILLLNLYVKILPTVRYKDLRDLLK